MTPSTPAGAHSILAPGFLESETRRLRYWRLCDLLQARIWQRAAPSIRDPYQQYRKQAAEAERRIIQWGRDIENAKAWQIHFARWDGEQLVNAAVSERTGLQHAGEG